MKTVKEALAVCRSFLDGVIIFYLASCFSTFLLHFIWRALGVVISLNMSFRVPDFYAQNVNFAKLTFSCSVPGKLI